MSELPSPPAIVTLGTVCLDCADADVMAHFYSNLLGWPISYRDHDFILLANPAGGITLSFQEEPWYRPPVWPEEPGRQDKMIHLDMAVTDLDAAVELALACGGRLAPRQFREDLRVILDPAGHPLCLCGS